MRKFIIQLFLFFLFSFPVYFLLVAVWGDYLPTYLTKNLSYRMGSNGHMFTRLKEVKEVKNIDILFLGSSHAYRGFDTRIFEQAGFVSFNLGSSAQTPMQTEILVNKYIESLNPKVVIYEVYPGTFELDGVESTLDLISNGKIDWQLIKLSITINNIKLTNTIIYRFYSDLLGRRTGYSENPEKGDDRYVKYGYVEKTPITYFKANESIALNRNFNERNFQAFKRLISTIKNRGVILILVQAPVTKTLQETYNDHEWFDSSMKTYGAYYNFNKIISLGDSSFYDKDHLNQNGVEEFNAKLIKLISDTIPKKAL